MRRQIYYGNTLSELPICQTRILAEIDNCSNTPQQYQKESVWDTSQSSIRYSYSNRWYIFIHLTLPLIFFQMLGRQNCLTLNMPQIYCFRQIDRCSTSPQQEVWGDMNSNINKWCRFIHIHLLSLAQMLRRPYILEWQYPEYATDKDIG